MTLLLAACLIVALMTLVGTLLLLYLPIVPGELRLWRGLRVGALRRWITRRRRVIEPFDAVRTPALARRNLLWHLMLTTLFTGQLTWAVFSPSSWWRPLAPLLVIPCIGYIFGSIVQRHKIALIRLRQRWRGHR